MPVIVFSLNLHARERYPSGLSLETGGSYTIEGQEVEQCVNTLGASWRLVGAPLAGTVKDDVIQSPVDILLSIFLSDGGYQTTTQFEPGLGCWVNLSEAGTLTLNGTGLGGAALAKPVLSSDFDGGRLWVEDIHGARQEVHLGVSSDQLVAMPPRPPAGVLDMRLMMADGLETYQAPEKFVADLPVRLQGDGPLALEWQIPAGGGRWQMWVEGRWHALATGGRLELADGDVAELFLRKLEGSAVPTASALDQNYPNPINPSTMIRYELMRPSPISLAVYDISGQLLKTLANGEHPAGRYTICWDGRDGEGVLAASGVYLYQLQADGFRSVHKMLPMK